MITELLFAGLLALPIQVQGEPVCEPWWEGEPEWVELLHFEELECVAPIVAHLAYTLSYNGVNFTFTPLEGDYVYVEHLDGELQDEAVHGRVAISAPGGLHIKPNHPLDHIMLWLGAHDCSDSFVPSLYCYNDAFDPVYAMNGDCWLRDQIDHPEGCTSIGPLDCPIIDFNDQWFFASLVINPLTGVEYAIERCEFVDNGRISFVSNVAARVYVPSQGGGGAN
jgi:hypothetical protein